MAQSQVYVIPCYGMMASHMKTILILILSGWSLAIPSSFYNPTVFTTSEVSNPISTYINYQLLITVGCCWQPLHLVPFCGFKMRFSYGCMWGAGMLTSLDLCIHCVTQSRPGAAGVGLEGWMLTPVSFVQTSEGDRVPLLRLTRACQQ